MQFSFIFNAGILYFPLSPTVPRVTCTTVAGATYSPAAGDCLTHRPVPVMDIAKKAMPMIIMFLVALLLITYIPQISLCLL